MKRNGITSAGRTRWRRTSCGARTVHRKDSSAKLLESFLGWLLTRGRQADMPGGGRTFRWKTARFWEIWPMTPKFEAPRRVVCVDGIHLGRKAVVLIASDGERVLDWHLCRPENSHARAALVTRIAEPEVAVSDGGDGLAKALGRTWPGARRQRCVFRAFSQVRRCTTTRPWTQAGAELHGLARALLAVTTLRYASPPSASRRSAPSARLISSQNATAPKQEAKPGYGVNVAYYDGKLIDLKEAGIVDPARVAHEAIQNAVSIASTAMTMGALVVDIPEKQPSNPDAGMSY